MNEFQYWLASRPEELAERIHTHRLDRSGLRCVTCRQMWECPAFRSVMIALELPLRQWRVIVSDQRRPVDVPGPLAPGRFRLERRNVGGERLWVEVGYAKPVGPFRTPGPPGASG